MTRAKLSIAYDGPALHDGSMEVRALAPALLAVGQLFDAANKVINGEQASIKVSVVATQEGSFEVLLGVDQDIIQKAIGLLISPEVTAAVNLRELIIGTGVLGGLLWLVKRLWGRDPEHFEKLSNNMVRITIDNETFDVPVHLLQLYQDRQIRDALSKLVAEPLEHEGIEKFVASDSEHKETVDKAESAYFKRPGLQDDLLTDTVKEVAFSIVSLTFKEDNKWRLNDGRGIISALIADKEFLDRVARNAVSFAKGDILICEVRMRQFRSGNGLKTEHIVQRVIEHRQSMRQYPLFTEKSDEKKTDNTV